MEDVKKVSLDKYAIFNNKTLISVFVEDSKYDLNEVFRDFDENGNVVKTTYQTTKTLEDGKKHVLKLEVYDEDEFQVEMLSLDDKEVLKWVYDKNGNLKEEKELNKSLHAMRFIEKITIFTPDKYIICGNFIFPLQIIYEPIKFHNYNRRVWKMMGSNLDKIKTFTKNNPKFEDKETVYNTWEENGIIQKTEEYIWNPELNSYEKRTYDKNNKLKEYEWKNPSSNESFSVRYDEKQKKVNLVYKNPNDEWIFKKINNIKFKDNDTFKNTVYYLLNKREEIKQEEEFKFKLKQLKNSVTKGLKRQIRG